MLSQLALQICDEADKTAINMLAERLQLSILTGSEIRNQPRITHILIYHNNRLSLLKNSPSAPTPTCVDFLDSRLAYRRKTSGRSQGIARAVGLARNRAPTVLDATAGLGRDSFILACLGCSVTMLERSTLIHALLEDGLVRAKKAAETDFELKVCTDQLSLFNEDARQRCREIMAGRAARPEVIYLDPMFPPRKKTAKVKKDIAVLQEMLGSDEDFPELLRLARQSAVKRVVVKRPGAGGEKKSATADFQVPGKSCHFDVYLCVG